MGRGRAGQSSVGGHVRLSKGRKVCVHLRGHLVVVKNRGSLGAGCLPLGAGPLWWPAQCVRPEACSPATCPAKIGGRHPVDPFWPSPAPSTSRCASWPPGKALCHMYGRTLCTNHSPFVSLTARMPAKFVNFTLKCKIRLCGPGQTVSRCRNGQGLAGCIGAGSCRRSAVSGCGFTPARACTYGPRSSVLQRPAEYRWTVSHLLFAA